jgi:hypothetical protein
MQPRRSNATLSLPMGMTISQGERTAVVLPAKGYTKGLPNAKGAIVHMRPGATTGVAAIGHDENELALPAKNAYNRCQLAKEGH